MLNLKKLLSKAGKINKVYNFADLEKDVLFQKTILCKCFVFFDLKEAFADAKK
jgi:hypothetical protein